MRREELEAAVDRHTYLRGYLVVPWGLGLLLLGVFGLWASAQGRQPYLKRSATAFVIALIALTIRRWYRDRLGRASYSRRGGRHAAAMPVLVSLVVVGLFLEQRLHGEFPNVPTFVHHVSALTALSALGMLAWHRMHVGHELHHVYLWGTTLALGLLPVWGYGETQDPTGMVQNQAFMLLGGALALGGVLDHRRLLEALPVPTAESDEHG